MVLETRKTVWTKKDKVLHGIRTEAGQTLPLAPPQHQPSHRIIFIFVSNEATHRGSETRNRESWCQESGVFVFQNKFSEDAQETLKILITLMASDVEALSGKKTKLGGKRTTLVGLWLWGWVFLKYLFKPVKRRIGFLTHALSVLKLM